VSFPGTPLAVDPDGNATFNLSSEAPGFPVLAFYPFLAEWPQPTPQPQITFGAGTYGTFSICTAFFSTIRVLAFDDVLLPQFIERWNLGPPPFSSAVAWEFVYRKILLTYDMLYPVMQQFVNLGSQSSVQSNIQTILQLIAEPGVLENTIYMPVTRELSAGARRVLQVWGGLVEAQYPQKLLDAAFRGELES